MSVCGTEGRYVLPACFRRLLETDSPPSESGPPQPDRKEVGSEAAMPTIAVGKWMDQDEAMMEPDGYLVRWESCIFHPVSGILHQQTHLWPNLVECHADIAV